MTSLLLVSGNASAQQIPESIQSTARGPQQICGVTGVTAQDFEALVRASADFEQRMETDQYTAYASPDGVTYWWVFAKRGHPAYPMATCRHTYQDRDGNWMADRRMRCDNTRETCDRAFLEFQELDRLVRRRLMGE